MRSSTGTSLLLALGLLATTPDCTEDVREFGESGASSSAGGAGPSSSTAVGGMTSGGGVTSSSGATGPAGPGSGGGVSAIGGAGVGGASVGPGAGGFGPGNDCDSYCTIVMTTCTGATQQYPTADTCKATCPAFPAGVIGDTNGDSVACRIYHAGNAAGNAALHCVHAGPSGGNLCGSDCEGYCDIVMNACKGPNHVYTDKGDCLAQCITLVDTVDFNANVMSGNSLACRTYHAMAAIADPSTHCAHTGPTSATCQ